MTMVRFLARGLSTGLCACAAVLLAVSGEVAESKSETRNVGTCGVGAVLNAGQYCSHKEGENKFKFTVENGEACIDFKGSFEGRCKLDVATEFKVGKFDSSGFSDATIRGCSKSEVICAGLQASERSGRWTIDSLPGLAASANEEESATGNPPALSPPQQSTSQEKEENKESASVRWKPPWADSDFPEIDYGHLGFRKYHKWSREIFGWWLLGQNADAADWFIAVNVSAVEKVWIEHKERTLRFQCHEGDISVLLYGAVEFFVLGDPLVTYRFGDNEAVHEIWRKDRGGFIVGLAGNKALDFVRKLRLHEKEGLSIGVRRRADEKLEEITFSLFGARKMVRAMAEHCPTLSEGAE